MKKAEKKTSGETKPGQKKARNTFDDLPLSKDDYKWMVIGSVIIFLGYILMSGGGTDNPEIFPGETLFSPRRMTLAPLMILAGMGVVLYGIVKTSKEDKPVQ
jgi:hypothetical protein